MTTCIALLSGINVGGRNVVAMSDLRRVVEELGFADVRSLLQSGNLVFRDSGRPAGSLEQLLEAQVETQLRLRTTFLIRTAKEWEAVIARNPFAQEATSDPGHLVVMFLKDAPGARAVKELQAAIAGPEIIRADGRQLYVVYTEGIGRSKLTNKLIESKLGTPCTGRNWNTVLKLAALAHVS
jgi:uncharacterized protein (DUF1697 family)